jgi:hypothetical protein
MMTGEIAVRSRPAPDRKPGSRASKERPGEGSEFTNRASFAPDRAKWPILADPFARTLPLIRLREREREDSHSNDRAEVLFCLRFQGFGAVQH